MKNAFVILLTVFISSCVKTKTEESGSEKTAEHQSMNKADLIGAWEATIETDSSTVKVVSIVTDGFLSTAGYNAADNAFYFTSGGQWQLDDGAMVITYEFDTQDSAIVGESKRYGFNLTNDTLQFDIDNTVWTRVDDGTPGDLAGAWLITGRKRDGEISKRTPGPRKTMKILSGTRFQWIAYNTETKGFMGTGGGTYTTVDGKYTEHIGFFSRDNSRVGASLEFDYSLENGDWHHSGFSSKGDPLYEIWSLRE